MRSPSRVSGFKYSPRIVEPKLANQSRGKGTGSVPTLPHHTNCNRSFLSGRHKRCSPVATRVSDGRPRRPAKVAAANQQCNRNKIETGRNGRSENERA